MATNQPTRFLPMGEDTLQFVSSHLIDETHSHKHARLPHTHKQELELFYVYRGTGQYMVDNHFYKISRGDIVICNAGILHGEDPSLGRHIHSYSVALTGVQIDNLPNNWLVNTEECPVVSCGQLAEQIGQLVRLIYLLSGDIAHLGEVCISLARSFLLLTQELLRSRARHTEAAAPNPAFALAHRAQCYLDEHYHASLTLYEVAHALGASEYYLAHVFRREIGMPPMQYVMKRRIGEAQSLLMDTTLPIADISDKLGFSSPCHFNTVFNKYVGMPPGRYRQSFFHMKENI